MMKNRLKIINELDSVILYCYVLTYNYKKLKADGGPHA